MTVWLNRQSHWVNRKRVRRLTRSMGLTAIYRRPGPAGQHQGTLPNAVKHRSLRSLQIKLIKIGGRLVRHARRLVFQLAEVAVPRVLFQGVLDRIGRLCPVPG